MNPDLYTLRIRFRGICTHFRNVVPGIPHRVVLPDAGAMLFGLADFAFSDNAPAATYYLPPHFPFLQSGGTGSLYVNGIIDNIADKGYIYTTARLQVMNALGPGIEYLPQYSNTPSLREYVPNYEYSPDVVTGGRAACYFDVFDGRIGMELTKGGANSVVIEMETDGPPRLMVVPLEPATGATPTSLTLAPDTTEGRVVTLTVANLELSNGETDDRQFDFLLHYLTARTGIPRVLFKATPGMNGVPTVQTPADIASGLRSFAEIIDPQPGAGSLPGSAPASSVDTRTALLKAIAGRDADEVTPSCSDSRYP
ncbi:MAG: hypothetical protein QOC81_4998 [Thermoanaerobaculia bacterium]|jgi:hypothetical protein|nr:hypothetical protein [Thermoanaerobaculia bacterium]